MPKKLFRHLSPVVVQWKYRNENSQRIVQKCALVAVKCEQWPDTELYNKHISKTERKGDKHFFNNLTCSAASPQEGLAVHIKAKAILSFSYFKTLTVCPASTIDLPAFRSAVKCSTELANGHQSIACAQTL